ncbi:MAG: lipopolysaccharide biosynthesis protein [Cytophagales bacterium]|nr:lipopolysaccharide biosynthesis protein [Cytophagales bacterium]
MSLKKQGAKSVKWNFIQNIILQFFTVLTTIILTRFLLPEDFGLVAIISVFLTVGKAVIDGGLTASLIRDNEADDEDYSTVFFTNLGISFLLYGLIFIAANDVAEFYEDDRLVALLRILSINLIFSGFSVVQEKLLIKELKFKKLAVMKLPGILIGSAGGIIGAIYGLEFWAIIVRELLNKGIDTVVFWSKSKWKPELRFSVPKFKHHFNFGYKLLLTNILNTLFTEIYSLIIGKFFSISVLGYFNRAEKYNQLPRKTITNVISTTTFPILSKIQDDQKKVSDFYKKLIMGLFFVLAPTFMLLGIIAKPLFVLLLTERWIDMISYFKIIVFASMIHPVIQVNGNVFKVFGRTDLTLKLALYSKILVVMNLVVGWLFGITYLLWARVISSYISFFLRSHFSSKLTQYTTLQQMKDISPTLITAIAMYLFGSTAIEFIEDYSRLAQIGILIVTSLPFYIFCNWIIKNQALKIFLELSTPVFQSFLKGKKG